MSIDWYNRNAQKFYAQTIGADITHLRNRFLAYIPAQGHLLDAGCGSGRDSKAFLEQGYQVTAFDASEAMVHLAREFTGLEILQRRFDEVTWQNEFNGVWACASLLHVPRSQISGMLAQLVSALVVGGILYVSFKLGQGERTSGGRFFSDYDEAALEKLCIAQINLEVIEVFISHDARPGRRQEWVNAIARKLSA